MPASLPASSPAPTSPLWRSLLLYREIPWHFGLTALLFLLGNIAFAGQQWLVGRAVHALELGAPHGVQAAIDGVLTWSIWLLGVALLRGALQYGAGLSSLISGQRLLTLLRERILVQVQRLDLGYHWRHGVGELVTRTTRDADKLRDALINFWRQVFELTLVVTATLGVLAWYHPGLAVVPLLLIGVAVTLFLRQTHHLVALDRATGAAYDQVNQELSEGVNGVRVVKSFVLEARRAAHFEAQVELFMRQATAALAYACARVPLPQAVVALGQVWILVFGLHLVEIGRLHRGELVAALLMANVLIFRAEGIGRVLQIFADARSSAARIWELLDAVPAIEGGTATLPARAGALGLSLDDVGVRAPGGTTAILDGCSLRIAPGEIVAVVGATGSGKSTLVNLLPRLLDVDAGRIRVGDDAHGWIDIRELRLDALRQAVQVVPQEAFLFSDTLEANLRLAAPDADARALEQALHASCADEVLERLHDGLATPVGDRGVTLSGGQRQRLALARALLARPRLLALDDATSALDALTEQRVLSRLRALNTASIAGPDAGGTTVLMVASKLSTVLQADRVLLLVDGRIAAAGRHHELTGLRAYRELLGLD
ncbi:ABC transporter ATP-binding protein [Mitsuaria sp. 7]|uniref:ABC transporter ATP-binding protein n=1 Tax=Mitsuaria sp. 7 TaxID=1658665 RepID=UPI0007DD5ECB|nr:ABC transporter ATP-binding protein [Mitsuaria sp. 7]ANH67767.1 ABC transporter ATP-binding protein [Mitsuaria sp. 7]